jgi:hypothetical protein
MKGFFIQDDSLCPSIDAEQAPPYESHSCIIFLKDIVNLQLQAYGYIYGNDCV